MRLDRPPPGTMGTPGTPGTPTDTSRPPGAFPRPSEFGSHIDARRYGGNPTETLPWPGDIFRLAVDISCRARSGGAPAGNGARRPRRLRARPVLAVADAADPQGRGLSASDVAVVGPALGETPDRRVGLCGRFDQFFGERTRLVGIELDQARRSVGTARRREPDDSGDGYDVCDPFDAFEATRSGP